MVIHILFYNKFKIKHNIIGTGGIAFIGAYFRDIFVIIYSFFYINDNYKIFFDTILILSGFFIGILIFFISIRYLNYNN